MYNSAVFVKIQFKWCNTLLFFVLFFFSFRTGLVITKGNLKLCLSPGHQRPKFTNESCRHTIFFVGTFSETKGKRQYLTDTFHCYTKWFVVVHSGPVYIRDLQGS